jgi:hypothetical protein
LWNAGYGVRGVIELCRPKAARLEEIKNQFQKLRRRDNCKNYCLKVKNLFFDVIKVIKTQPASRRPSCCVFPLDPNTDSRNIRTLIPALSGH